MPEPTTGTKPDPGVMPTQDVTGTKDQSVMPTDVKPIIEEEPTPDIDGQKDVVPFSSYKAEKEKRQALAEELAALKAQQDSGRQPPPQEPEPTGEFDWDSFLGTLNVQPQQSSTQQTPAQPAQPAPQPHNIQQINEQIAEMRANGNEIGAYALLRQLENSYVNNMKRTARQWIKGYDELPLNTVSDDEVMAVQQNFEAIRGILAKVKSGKGGIQTKPTTASASQPATLEELQEKWKQMGREEAIHGISTTSGTSGEGSRTAVSASVGEAYELGEEEKQWFLRRGYTKEQLPELAKKVKHELELQGRF